jgi:hypothetical protein
MHIPPDPPKHVEVNAKSHFNGEELANAALASMLTGFDALTFLAEFKEVPRMVLKVGRRLYQLLTSPSPLKIVNGYLEVRYGWGPFLRDLQQLYELLESIGEEVEEKVVRKTRSRSLTESNTFQDPNDHTPSNQGFYGIWVRNVTTSVSVKGFAIAKIAPPKVEFDPIKTGWEIVPFSFVVDWFYSIGTTLDALSAARIASYSARGVGMKLTIDTVGNWTDLGMGNPDYQGSCSQSSGHRIELKTRSSALPVTSYLPSISFDLGGQQILDLLALLSQAFLRR